MQSDKNINQEYFTETFHVIFWVSVKMIELRWTNNYLNETGHWSYNVREYEDGLKIVKSDKILFKHTKIKSCQQSV